MLKESGNVAVHESDNADPQRPQSILIGPGSEAGAKGQNDHQMSHGSS
jgi:hypothetical protein